MHIQWLSHSCVKITTATHCLLVDPFFTGNPVAPCTWQQASLGVTHILLTHGHDDHVGDTAAIAAHTGATVVGMVELVNALAEDNGLKHCEMANLGGTVDLGGGHAVKLVPAWHSTGAGAGGAYAGVAAGLVITVPGQVIYHAGDTCVFGDMELIDALEQPTIGLLPIGGRFTMDGADAAYAARHFFHFEHIIPIHYGTFPLLAPTAEAFLKAGEGLPIRVLKPGGKLEL